MNKTNKSHTDFISMTSHHLRTPLSGVKWLLELVQKDKKKLPEKQRKLLEKVYASNKRMITLVNDLLEVSQIESKQLKLYLQPVDLTEIIRGLIKENENEIREKRLKVSFFEDSEPLPLAKTEQNKIRHAIGNLLSNAIDYTNTGGSIRIELKPKNDQVQGLIEDSGVGIPKQQQKHIFKKFFRGSNILKFETYGAGLGLFIAKSFFEASKGKLWFKSAEGKGTTFYFTLPAVK